MGSPSLFYCCGCLYIIQHTADTIRVSTTSSKCAASVASSVAGTKKGKKGLCLLQHQQKKKKKYRKCFFDTEQIITPDQARRRTDFLLFGLVAKLQNSIAGTGLCEVTVSYSQCTMSPQKRRKQVTS